ncbi:MAG: isoprenylcysteine carboxylmethyltransferase family protein [Bacteroidota bacterium]|nr:isoprenylcysteine carboxylmethyltransferase family protein [Bacteroidota bacterium]
MKSLIVFGILSIPILLVSWRTLFNIRSHGFYRFFSWECILWLFASNYPIWFDNPFSVHQIFSWILLISSIYPVVAGTLQLKKSGKPTESREEKTLYDFEKTSELVDNGIYKYIRHPLYTSLIILSWGIFLKNINGQLFLITMLSTIFLYITARFDEKECIQYFGIRYLEYMKRSKRFIPFLI